MFVDPFARWLDTWSASVKIGECVHVCVNCIEPAPMLSEIIMRVQKSDPYNTPF